MNFTNRFAQRRLNSTVRFSILCKTNLHAVFISIFQGLVVGIGFRILRAQLHYTAFAEIICFNKPKQLGISVMNICSDLEDFKKTEVLNSVNIDH